MKLLVLFLVAVCASTACVDFEIDNDTHYKTGVAAFHEFESDLSKAFTPFDNALKMDAFIGYVEANTLNDNSNLLNVWLTAEDIYFPKYRVRNSVDSWWCIDGTDTLFMVATGGTPLPFPGSSWDYLESGSQIQISLGEDMVYYYSLDKYNVKIGSEYNYYSAIINAEIEIYPQGDLLPDSLNANIYELSGNLSITTNRYYSDYYSYSSGDQRKVTLSANIPETSKLRHNIVPASGGIFDQGGYTLGINDQTLGLSENVQITITPLPSYKRSVTINYRGDTVTLNQ